MLYKTYTLHSEAVLFTDALNKHKLGFVGNILFSSNAHLQWNRDEREKENL